MKKCVVCKTAEATIRDREDYPRYRISLCEDCHAERLRSDIIAIVKSSPPKKKS